jgi:hypothetical protein
VHVLFIEQGKPLPEHVLAYTDTMPVENVGVGALRGNALLPREGVT